MQTLYQFGREEILRLIVEYLELLEQTDGMKQVSLDSFTRPDWRFFLLCGRGLSVPEVPEDPVEAHQFYTSRSAISHDLETAVSGPLYVSMRRYVQQLIDEARILSADFSQVEAEQIHSNPEFIPVFLHVTGTFSKAVLAKEVGQVSDAGVSKPASARLANFFSERIVSPAPSNDQLSARMGPTIEGQIRDLLGRYLLEALVEAALSKADVPFQREKEYGAIGGVVYDHRADFVVPNALDPLLFVEVRKSSARHSSLYAKDKMFSAINWKGRHERLIGVLITDGEWSRHALIALAKVFDYVLPVNEADKLARIAGAYLAGDSSMLRRVIHFSIEERLKATD